MSSHYYTRDITIYFEDHNYGDLPINTTNYLSDLINKAINLTPFDPENHVIQDSKQSQESLFGILMVGLGNRIIDFIAFNSKDDIVKKAHVRIDDMPRHKWTYGNEVRRIGDIPFYNMKEMHLIADPSLLPKCFTVIDSHCNMEWLLKYNKILPPANVKRQYRRGRKIYMRELYQVLHKKSEYNRPPIHVINTVKDIVLLSPTVLPQPTVLTVQNTIQDNNNDSIGILVKKHSKFPILEMMTDSSNIEYGYHKPNKG